jgi:hypothetical protein
VKISSIVIQLTLALLLICVVSSASSASILDLTLFGGTQNPGKLTFSSATSSTGNMIATFDPKTFGTFGARLGHGGLIGGEHTIAYSPNFLESGTHAFTYHSNLRVQPTFSFVKPYATAGVGLVATGGNSLADFGTKFGFNYGGGVTLGKGGLGFNLDVRGYAVPKVTILGFTGQDRLDYLQTTVGITFGF